MKVVSIPGTNGKNGQTIIHQAKAFRESLKEVIHYDSVKELNEIKELQAKGREAEKANYMTKKDMELIMSGVSKEIKSVKRAIEDRPQYMPLTKGMKGYLRKTPLKSDRIYFEEKI
jgi:NACalpha-BTF3-like transcription factor